MNLPDAPKRLPLEVVSVKKERLLSDAMRFGIQPGEIIMVINKLPNGPVIIQKNQQQIAIGLELANAIDVKTKN